MIRPPQGKRAKQLGAYYTDQVVAEFIACWALRSPNDTVLDPSFGGGVFIEAAIARLEFLGGNIGQINGVEIDPEVHQRVSDKVCSRYNLPRARLICRDFYDVDATDTSKVDAVTGNPPYIRSQSFAGAVREKALKRASDQGVKVSGLASSWATFLVHSCSLLKCGGRLAFVIPTEIGHAPYARAVLEYLMDTFALVELVTFKKRLFPHINQDTLIVLAEDKGGGSGELYTRDFKSGAELQNVTNSLELPSRKRVDAKEIIRGNETLAHAFISEKARRLYKQLSATQAVTLGDIANVGIGYVSGANRFFHLSAEQAGELDIEQSYLKQAVFKARALSGLQVTRADLKSASKGSAGYLLELSEASKLSASVKSYIAKAENEKVHLGYKCKSRSPWYEVPGVVVPDAFLTYMSGLYPHLVANSAGATAPNTLHLVRIKEGADVRADALSLLWNSSLTSLSVELEGHALGGGMLKLEPREARSVRVAWPQDRTFSKAEFTKVDSLLRQGKKEAAIQEVDELLRRRQGLGKADYETLREAAELLRIRRYYKGERS